MSRLNKVVEKELKAHGLDNDAVKNGLNVLLEFSYDAIEDAESVEESVAILFSVKTICITHGIKKPKWWYGQRNKTDWQDEEDGFRYGYDLGGF